MSAALAKPAGEKRQVIAPLLQLLGEDRTS